MCRIIIQCAICLLLSIGIAYGETIENLYSEINTGFGGSYAFPFDDGAGNPIWVTSRDLVLDDNISQKANYQGIVNFDGAKFAELQQYLFRAKYINYWLSNSWQESWFSISSIQELMDAGYIPVFNYWYFGDNLNGIPDQNAQAEYLADATRLGLFLSQLVGMKFVIMEPEFNKKEITVDETTQHALKKGTPIKRPLVKVYITPLEKNVFVFSLRGSSVFSCCHSCNYLQSPTPGISTVSAWLLKPHQTPIRIKAVKE